MRLTLRETGGPALALFASTGTLICCALPALLVTLGAGAVMAGLISHVPGLVVLSANKNWVFAFATAMLATAWSVRYLTRNAPCPADPGKAAACSRMRSLGGVILWIATGLMAVGVFFAYFATDLLL